MKVLFFCMLLFVAVNVFAADVNTVFNSPVSGNLAVATFFDLKVNDIFYGGTLPLVSYRDLVAIEAGVLTAGEHIATHCGLALNISKLAKGIGLDVNKVFENAKIGGYVARYMEAGRPIQADMAGLYIGTLITF